MKQFLFLSLLVVPTVLAGSPPQLEPLVGVCKYLDDNFADNSQVLQSSTVRLPNNVVPYHYNLELRPILTEGDPDQFKAPGKVTIDLTCLNSSNSITLHSKEIEIKENEVQVLTAGGTPVPVANHVYDPAVSTYTIMLQSQLTPNENYTLTIPFTALVAGNRLEGLYRSSYEDADNNTRWLATTQFQKLGARMAFPCFDEPALRATFDIKMGRTAAFHSLSNAPVLRKDVPIDGLNGWFWDEYETTVSMSTYLVAFIVSDFASVEAPASMSNYTVKTWGPPPMTTAETGKFSSEAAAKILNFLENYYDFKYQFPKLDSVAIPDFEAGAMENWGLNTYRIVLMLWFDGESTQFEQWRQSAVIAHEIVHHWFGDLVTCDWWNDLWLNEGFARYMQFIGSTATGSDFGQRDRYTIDVIQLAMDYDVTANSVPVHSDVTDQVVNQPSRIIYEKAAALIRMMQGFLSEETLIKGLRNYLKDHAYKNTVQDQLFASLQAQADADLTMTEFTVKEIMDTWTLQTGFPLVRVTNAGSNRVFISQERFELSAQRQTVKQNNGLWFVPVSIATKQVPDFSENNWKPALWLDKLTILKTYPLGESNANEWVVVNPDARYYYRVIYDDHFFNLIKEQLETDHTVFSLSTRSQMIDDYFKSSIAKYVNIKRALDLTQYLSKENENTVWTTVFNNIRPIYRYLQDQPATVALLREYFLQRIEPTLSRIGWEEGTADTPVTWFLRAQLFDWACVFGSANCTAIANSKIPEWGTDPSTNPIRADLQPMIFCKGVSIADSFSNGVNVRSRLIELYEKAYRAEQYSLVINSLACESNPNELQRLMNMTIDEESAIENKPHGTAILQRIAENPQNRQTVIDWLETSKAAVTAVLGQSAFSSVISTIAAYTTSTSMADTVSTTIERWISDGTVTEPSVITSLQNSKSVLNTNAQWIADYAGDINAWLTEASSD